MTALKTTSYYVEGSDGINTGRTGEIWTISLDTPDGMVELELSRSAACWVRQGLEDAVCAKCEPEEPKPVPDPVPDLMAALKASDS